MAHHILRLPHVTKIAPPALVAFLKRFFLMLFTCAQSVAEASKKKDRLAGQKRNNFTTSEFHPISTPSYTFLISSDIQDPKMDRSELILGFGCTCR